MRFNAITNYFEIELTIPKVTKYLCATGKDLTSVKNMSTISVKINNCSQLQMHAFLFCLCSIMTSVGMGYFGKFMFK